MSIIEIIVLLVSIVCFFGWNELRNNKIKNDEKQYFVIGVLLIVLFILLLYMGHDTSQIDLDE